MNNILIIIIMFFFIFLSYGYIEYKKLNVKKFNKCDTIYFVDDEELYDLDRDFSFIKK
tara:strand:- start:1771 stop:1944 length:174 start_codon:yes stop_codon:yes gene_type:complete